MTSWIEKRLCSLRAGIYINKANKQVSRIADSDRATIRVLMPLSVDLIQSQSLPRVIDDMEQAPYDHALDAFLRAEHTKANTPKYQSEFLKILSPDITHDEKKQLTAFFMFNRISLNVWLATISGAVVSSKIHNVYDMWDLLNSAEPEFDQAMHDVRAVNEFIALRLGRPFHAWIDHIDIVGEGWHRACQWHPRDKRDSIASEANK